MVGGTVAAARGGLVAAGAAGRGIRTIIQGGEALGAARRGVAEAAPRFRPRDTLPLGSTTDELATTGPRFIPRDRREMLYMQEGFLRRPPPWRSLPRDPDPKVRIDHFDRQTRPYYQQYNRPWDAVGNRLEVPPGMTMQQVRLMERVVREVVDSAEFPGVVGAKIALPNPAGTLSRADSIVIYTNGEKASERVLQRLQQYQRENPDMFLDSTPRMTQWRSPGVATGAEPSAAGVDQWRRAVAEHTGIPAEAVAGQRTSFGSIRADAMYLAQEDLAALRARTGMINEQRDSWYLQQRTDHWFRRFGIDPEHPHRNLPN
jgi:hypothetical protein